MRLQIEIPSTMPCNPSEITRTQNGSGSARRLCTRNKQKTASILIGSNENRLTLNRDREALKGKIKIFRIRIENSNERKIYQGQSPESDNGFDFIEQG